MKKKILIATVCAGLLATSAMARGHYGTQTQVQTPTATTVSTSATTQSSVVAPVSGLTQQQAEDLVFMYEEEKMARDTYMMLGDIWGLSTFSNIQNAEQRHMDSIKSLLQKYNIPVPATSYAVGAFENGELQALYNQLVDQGSASSQDALEVGVLIEETDIADLEEKIIGAPDDVRVVYESLLRGSYNHLRAFNRLLDSGTTSNYGRRGR